jgi:hypothetical protein
MSIDCRLRWTDATVRLSLLMVLSLNAGCGGSSAPPGGTGANSSVPRLRPPAQRSAPEPPATEPEKPPPAAPPARPVGPWLQWQLAQGPAAEGKCFLKLIVDPDRDSIVQLASYDTPEREQFPSLFLRAVTRANTIQELLNQKLSAQLYAQIAANGSPLHNLPNQTVEIFVTAIEGQHVRGTFAGQAHDVDSGADVPVSGNFQAVVETGRE